MGEVTLGEERPREIHPGEIVSSRQGRDRGRYYLCLGPPEGRYLSLADGRIRPVRRPKKKSLRHVVPTGYLDQEAAERSRQGSLDDRAVREAFERFKNWLERRGEDGQGGDH